MTHAGWRAFFLPYFLWGNQFPHTPCNATHCLWVEGEMIRFWLKCSSPGKVSRLQRRWDFSAQPPQAPPPPRAFASSRRHSCRRSEAPRPRCRGLLYQCRPSVRRRSVAKRRKVPSADASQKATLFAKNSVLRPLLTGDTQYRRGCGGTSSPTKKKEIREG